MIRVFIGYDRAEPVVFNTLAHSLMTRASAPLAITPVSLSHLEGVLVRERHPLQSTEFSFSRFLVPYLAGYDGWALFMDNDFLARDDIAALWQLRDDRYAVMCVKHNHRPAAEVKFNNYRQTVYEKKNWSSLMLLNCARCRALTVDYVNRASGLELHQFKWLGDDAAIGELPGLWNHLVGHDPYDAGAKMVHFTEGGPYFAASRQCDYADEWFAAWAQANAGSQASVSRLLTMAADGRPTPFEEVPE